MTEKGEKGIAQKKRELKIGETKVVAKLGAEHKTNDACGKRERERESGERQSGKI